MRSRSRIENKQNILQAFLIEKRDENRHDFLLCESDFDKIRLFNCSRRIFQRVRADLLKSRLITKIPIDSRSNHYCITPLGISYLISSGMKSRHFLIKQSTEQKTVLRILQYTSKQRDNLHSKIWKRIELIVGGSDILYPLLLDMCDSIHIDTQTNIITLQYAVSSNLRIILKKFLLEDNHIIPIIMDLDKDNKRKSIINEKQFFKELSDHMIKIFCYRLIHMFGEDKFLNLISDLDKYEAEIVMSNIRSFHKSLKISHSIFGKLLSHNIFAIPTIRDSNL